MTVAFIKNYLEQYYITFTLLVAPVSKYLPIFLSAIVFIFWVNTLIVFVTLHPKLYKKSSS